MERTKIEEKYTKDNILKVCQESLQNVYTFYKLDMVKKRGFVTGNKEYITEIIADFLLQPENYKKFTGMKSISRTNAKYAVKNHNGKYIIKKNKLEKHYAMDLRNQCMDSNLTFPEIGKIFDYEVPLKNQNAVEEDASKSIGKVDLISMNDKKKKVYLLELKRPDSDESLLRCVLEAYTYKSIVDKDKLFADYTESNICEFKDINIPKDYELKAIPLIFKDSKQAAELDKEKHPKLFELMDKLDIDPYAFIIEQSEDKKYRETT